MHPSAEICSYTPTQNRPKSLIFSNMKLYFIEPPFFLRESICSLYSSYLYKHACVQHILCKYFSLQQLKVDEISSFHIKTLCFPGSCSVFMFLFFWIFLGDNFFKFLFFVYRTNFTCRD